MEVAKQIHNLEQMDEGEQADEGNISSREKGSWPRPPNNEGMQQHLYTEPEVTIKSVNGKHEHQAATYAKSQDANPMSNKPALPPHLLKTVPPPPYLQGQPLVANYTPYCYPPLNQITSQSPAVPPRTNPNMVVGMATANTSDTRQPFLRQTMPQKRRMLVQESGARFRILTFNCKNVVTSKIALQEFYERVGADILLLQEHWLFDCYLHRLSEISQYIGARKAVDTNDPILPVQMPPGYGGVAVLWKKDIDHLVKVCSEGGNRIQCVELNGEDRLLIISVDMPCKGLTDNIEDFRDCVDQLNEIVNKCKPTHKIIIGGDINEELKAAAKGRRGQYFRDFIEDNDLELNVTKATYISPAGSEISTLDYFVVDKRLPKDTYSVERLENIDTNVSDHLPVKCELDFKVQNNKPNETKNLQHTSKVKWQKVDRQLYSSLVKNQLLYLR